MTPTGIRTLARAVTFAAEAHRGQVRDDGAPYLAHPIRVCEWLRSIGGEDDVEVLCAAVLHDTIEDSGTTFDDVAEVFGARVAKLVAALSNDTRLPKPERKSAMIAHAPQLPPEAKRVKLADRLDNVLDFHAWSAARQSRYLEESRRLLAALRGACPPLERALGAAIRNAGETRRGARLRKTDIGNH
ncbi:MAG: bifunctional (p)ppGpp synthetase/guanosine-3',5'-bis(diphosphate) 3'-pyrophosphohydrolase [Planctomycetes bacterium]|nr:bifunctional (p)ppGpp synthetase/guanosine-3',5'-bis(diphosphate) 3'-pyrophosphohydrolase [Planctomycetota bacterium]